MYINVAILIIKHINFITDACENVKCGVNAQCIANRHTGQCKCKTGYIGNPVSEKGCKLKETTCKSKSDCPDGRYCNKDVCRGKLNSPRYFLIKEG